MPKPAELGYGVRREAARSGLSELARRLGRDSVPAAMRGVVPNASEALVYVIEQDEAVRDSLKALIESNGFCVQSFATQEEFLMSTEPGAASCVVLGFGRYGADSVRTLRTLRKHRPGLPIIFIVGQRGTASSAITCEDAFVQLERPVQEAALIQAIQRAREH